METGNVLSTNDGNEFSYIFDKYGYKLVVKEPKYLDSVLQEASLNPTYYYLFKLNR